LPVPKTEITNPISEIPCPTIFSFPTAPISVGLGWASWARACAAGSWTYRVTVNRSKAKADALCPRRVGG
jgi:hypothetical protein